MGYKYRALGGGRFRPAGIHGTAPARPHRRGDDGIGKRLPRPGFTVQAKPVYDGLRVLLQAGGTVQNL